ncbi:replication-relaxation family protein [Calycomorphotria hydatis]|uniref:Replication-relaxation n=1 Tax=Calycomorphotria hydatis TaxID=2528027 RepID=A0A517T6T1_9PLAN|nr:replication-relaxation family protein [Calycomorphotria hydatis]QDT64082.1 hypothetical protein V22_13130 [Calycomorphotria hydatis]
MPKKFSTRIGPRDLELLTALDRSPLTPAQLCRLSATFAQPFHDENNLRRRLRLLSDSGLVRSWPYALINDGRAPCYFKLTRDGYRLLYGVDAPLPRRRYFEEINHGHHHHTFALAELIVHLAVQGHRQGIELCHFARENSVKLEADGFTLYPDCAFQLRSKDGGPHANDSCRFNFTVELDNGTERVRSTHDIESIERKLRGYDRHQGQFEARDPRRYMVLLITTRSAQRLEHMLSVADAVMHNRQRTCFLGCTLSEWLEGNLFREPLLRDHRGLRKTLIPMLPSRAGMTNAATPTALQN